MPTFRLKGTVLIYLFYYYLPDSLNGLTAQLIETYCHIMGESTIYALWGSLTRGLCGQKVNVVSDTDNNVM